MSGARIVAAHGLSPLGRGDAAYGIGLAGEHARVAVTDDAAGRSEGLARPRAARIAMPVPVPDGRDRATELLILALRGCVEELDRTRPGWRAVRVGLVFGTSSGPMAALQTLFAKWACGHAVSRDEARGATYFAPVLHAILDVGIPCGDVVQVLGACASSTIAVGLGLRWLELGRCDLVIAAGYDALSSFVTAGFESLAATTASFPRPFRLLRDGMALGEGSVAVALVPATDDQPHSRSPASGAERGHVLGFGMSTDALHLTAPDRSGRGLARAASAALADARVPVDQIDLVSAHATATPFNDAAESRALALALGGARPHAVHPLKAQIGHTLGAAGLLETMAIIEAMRRGIAPAAAGDGDLDPACAVPLLATNTARETRFALKLSSAFGGANASLVVAATAPPGGASPRLQQRGPGCSGVHLRRHAAVWGAHPATVTELLARCHPHPHRPDALARLVVAAVHALGFDRHDARAARTGLVVGHTLATFEQNHAFETRRRTRGARLVEARRFPATSPNAAVGECAIAFGLEGPSFAVGASLHGGLEALGVARDLIAAGDAHSMLVVCVHLAGDASSALLAAAKVVPIEPGACAAYLHETPGPDGVRLPSDLPTTLDARQTIDWSGVVGPAELAAYLCTLQKPFI